MKQTANYGTERGIEMKKLGSEWINKELTNIDTYTRSMTEIMAAIHEAGLMPAYAADEYQEALKYYRGARLEDKLAHIYAQWVQTHMEQIAPSGCYWGYRDEEGFGPIGFWEEEEL